MSGESYLDFLADSVRGVQVDTLNLLTLMVGTYPGDPLCTDEELNLRLLRAGRMKTILEQRDEWQLFLDLKIRQLHNMQLGNSLLNGTDRTIKRMTSAGLNAIVDCETFPLSDSRTINIVGGPGFLDRVLRRFQSSADIKQLYTDDEVALLRLWQSFVVLGDESSLI